VLFLGPRYASTLKTRLKLDSTTALQLTIYNSFKSLNHPILVLDCKLYSTM
jgi:hypothetical protein